MDQAGEILVNLFVPPFTGALIGACAVGFGALLAQPFYSYRRPPLVESFALGCIAISLLTLLWSSLHWMGAWSRWSLALLLILLGITGWIRPRISSPMNIRSFRNRTILVLSLLLVLGFVFKVFSLALFPPYAPEECSTYLPASQAILEAGRTVYNPSIAFSSLPQNTEMLYAWSLMFSPLSSAHFVNLLAFVFSLTAMIRLGRSAFSLKTGWLAALFLGSFSAVQWLACRSYPDLWVMFYLLAAMLTGLEAFKNGRPGLLLLSGIFMGAAAGAGHAGALGAVTLGISLLALGKWRMPAVKRMQFEDIFAAFLVALAVASPWYIRNAIWFHNPAFPFMTNIFPPGGGTYGSYGPESAVDFRRMMSAYTAAGFFERDILWARLIDMWPVWAAVPAGLWFWRTNPVMRIAVTWTLLTWAYWMIIGGGIMYTSFYLYLAPVTALAVAHLAGKIYTFPPGDHRGRFARILLWILLIGWVGIITTKGDQVSPPLTASAQKEFLSRNVQSYNLIEAANVAIPKTSVATGIFCGDARLYADFPLVGGGDQGLANHRILADSSTSALQLADLLRERYNSSFLVVNEERLKSVEGQEYPQILKLLESSEFGLVFREITRIGTGAIYYIEPAPEPPTN